MRCESDGGARDAARSLRDEGFCVVRAAGAQISDRILESCRTAASARLSALLARAVTVLLVLGVIAPGVRATPMAAFQARAQRCFEESHAQLCEQALIEAESL